MKRSLLVLLIFITLSVAGRISPQDSGIQYYGRVDRSQSSEISYGWPGVHFEFNFTGTSLTLHFENDENRYEIFIDEKRYPILTTRADNNNYLITNDLNNSVHKVLVHRRSETNWAKSTFTGITLSNGGELRDAPARRQTKIEIIGDSFITGYGTESSSINGEYEQFFQTTNTMKAFSAVVGKHYKSDYIVSGFSGRGLVRNGNNIEPDKPYGKYYDLVIPSEINTSNPVKWDHTKWKPDLIIMNFGLNDFSGTIEPADSDQWKETYHKFIDTLQSRAPGVNIILCATQDWPLDILRDLTKEVVDERPNDNSVYYYYYKVGNTGLDNHPSVREHQTIAEGLIELIDQHNLLENSTGVTENHVSSKQPQLTISHDANSINLSLPSAGEYQFSLYSLSGRQLMTKHVRADYTGTISFDLHMAPGVYMTTILGKGINYSSRMVWGN